MFWPGQNCSWFWKGKRLDAELSISFKQFRTAEIKDEVDLSAVTRVPLEFVVSASEVLFVG